MAKKQKLPSPTRIGMVRLRVANLILMSSFYRDIVGLELLEQDSQSSLLGVDGRPIVQLIASPGGGLAPSRPGLFHLAILLPKRQQLAVWLRQYLRNGQQLTGAADHLVSEALYFSDPEGNGIEIYRDRPKEQWQHADGQLQMATNRLDVQALFREAGNEDGASVLPSGTTLGHVHLQVNDLTAGLQFYRDMLGFDLMTSYPGAEFLSAGGYHHHIAINTWNSASADTRTEDLLGLDSYSLLLPDEAARNDLTHYLTQNGVDVQTVNDIPVVTDPAGNRLTLEIDR